MGKKKNLGKLAIGAALGASAGILLAPRSGRETRAILKCKIDEMMCKIKEMDSAELREEFDKKIKEIEKEIKALDKEKVLSVAKDKAIIIKEKADDLVEAAVSKGDYALQKAADDVRDKAVEVIKNVLVKLEEDKK